MLSEKESKGNISFLLFAAAFGKWVDWGDHVGQGLTDIRVREEENR